MLFTGLYPYLVFKEIVRIYSYPLNAYGIV